MEFDSVIGHKKTIDQLKKTLKADKLPPAFLFHGPKGVGKMMAARIMAKAANCLDGQAREKGDACGHCRMCQAIERNIHPDIIIADFDFQAALVDKPADKQKHILIETIRAVIEKSQQKAVDARKKVFIIDSAETMLAQAANSLLKLLEEPPPNTFLVLVSANRAAMLGTILSRSQETAFAPLSTESTEEVLIQQGISADEAARLAPLAQGSVHRALKIRQLEENLSDLDKLDPMYPFHVSAHLPAGLDDARKDAALIIELLIADAHRKMISADNAAKQDLYKDSLDNLFKRREYINRNVSPHRVLEAAIMECEKLNINFSLTTQEN
ncbi:MAG: DNA polymerase III subunit delta' [Elusimicrobiaceae bacterium]